MRIRILCVAALLAAGCSFKGDPDHDRFTCAADADCGDGYTCVAQRAGGAACFPKGACGVETCNGQDDDCDGVIDDVADAGSACTTSLPGACSAGVLACTDAGFACVAITKPQAERCDGTSDLDCDGLVGCADPDCDGTSCGDGCVCRGGVKVETDCGNGTDDDGDGLIDCDDPDCVGLDCGSGGNCGSAGPNALDAGFTDDGGLDAGFTDDGGLDAGFVDGGSDAGFGDDGGLDAGSIDDGGLDAGSIDDGGLDAGTPDDGGLDAGSPDDGGSGDDGGFDGGPAPMNHPPHLPSADAGFYCALPETNCADGVDNDGDGRTDCLDGDCLGLACGVASTCAPDGGCVAH